MGRKPHDKGFTLIEIIIVIGIVAGLAAVLFTSYNTTMKKTRDGRRKADLHIIQTALEESPPLRWKGD